MKPESTTLDKTKRLMTERSSKRAAGKPEQACKRQRDVLDPVAKLPCRI